MNRKWISLLLILTVVTLAGCGAGSGDIADDGEIPRSNMEIADDSVVQNKEIRPVLSLPEEQIERLDISVIEYAMEYVRGMIACHNEFGAADPDRSYSIIKAHITSIENIPIPAVGLTDGLYLYCLEYRLLADHPENVFLAGGMTMDGNRITEWGSLGKLYLLLWSG